jgi:hypothetical protein
MNLSEYQAKKRMLEKEMRELSFIKAGCQQCQHFDFGKCKVLQAEIPNEFIVAVEQCEHWEHDSIPFITCAFSFEPVRNSQKRMRQYEY